MQGVPSGSSPESHLNFKRTSALSGFFLSSPSVSVGDPFWIVNFQRGFPPGTRGNDKLVWFQRSRWVSRFVYYQSCIKISKGTLTSSTCFKRETQRGREVQTICNIYVCRNIWERTFSYWRFLLCKPHLSCCVIPASPRKYTGPNSLHYASGREQGSCVAFLVDFTKYATQDSCFRRNDKQKVTDKLKQKNNS